MKSLFLSSVRNNTQSWVLLQRKIRDKGSNFRQETAKLATCILIMYVIPLIKPPRYNRDTKNPTSFLYSESNISYAILILQGKIKTEA